MGLHWGQTKLPATMTFMRNGYWFKGSDDADYEWRQHPAPKPQTRRVRRMWGVSFGGAGGSIFFGLIRFSTVID